MVRLVPRWNACSSRPTSTLQVCQFLIEVVRLVPRERVQQQTDEHSVGVPVSQILEGTVEVVRLVPQARVNEQIVEVPIPQITEEGHCRRVSSYNRSIYRKGSANTFHKVDAIETLQLQVRSISNESKEKCSDVDSDREVFLIKKHELGMQRDECSKKIDALRE